VKKPSRTSSKAGASASAPQDEFGKLLARAEALAKGDDVGLKKLIAAMIAAKFSHERCDPILRAASKATGIGLKLCKDLTARARAALRRREDAKPTAQQAQLLVQEAAAKAAEAERAVERERLWTSCKTLADDAEVLTKMARATQRLGMVGEDQSVRAVCLSLVSRLLKDGGVNIVRRGAPAGGKNYLVSTTTMLMRPESIIAVSAASPTARIYFGDDENALRHKVIIIAEAAAIAAKSNGDEHPLTILLRTLLSEGRIDRLVTIPQQNGLSRSVHVRRNGPVVAILTTARDNVDEEMLTRVMVLDADETSEQTDAIIARKLGQGAIAEALTEGEIERWRDFQRWLELGAPYEIDVPFQGAIHQAWLDLVKQRPNARQLRIRRDITGLLAAVKASAVLHSAQGSRVAGGKILATLDDYRHAWEAFDPGLSALYGMRTRAEMIAVVQAAESLGVPLYDGEPPTCQSVKLTAAMMCKGLGINSKKTAINRIQEAVERGALKEDDARRGRGRGSPHYFWLLQQSTDLKNRTEQGGVFPSPAEVEKKWKEGEGAETRGQEEQEEQDEWSASASCSSRSSCPRNSTPSPIDEKNRAQKAQTRGNGRKSGDLTPREAIDAVRGAGAQLERWPDGSGFSTDLKFVTDVLTRDTLLEAIQEHYDAILAELNQEAARAS
jgi:hypothetical protein